MLFDAWAKKREQLQLAERYLTESCHLFHLSPKQLTTAAKDWIAKRKDFPAEELRRIIAEAALVAKGDVDACHFTPRLLDDHEAFAGARFEHMALEETVHHKLAHFFARIGDHDVTDVYPAVMKQVERPLIQLALKWAGGNQQKAAHALGLHRNTLRKKMRELKIV
ncbi:MAG: hypothetical protein HY540_08030 [Deltaproteobacteria bacterium]|nr:hypothetical protein [Deltaproteobacteria bacterium]